MKIAILGAGFAGLATAWTLLHQQAKKNIALELTIFDAEHIGAGASGIAAGLMHPFANIHSKINRWGAEGFEASMALLTASEEALGKRPYNQSGILRPALSAIQEKEFHAAANKHPQDIQWMEAEAIATLIPGVLRAPGILIKKGATVYPEEYLQGLWLACQNLGATFQPQKIHSPDELKHFDIVIVAMGANCGSFQELSHLPLRYTKGQILELLWPEGLLPLPMALNAHIYCVMLPDKKRCLVGSTYEKQFATAAADVAVAKAEILPKLASLYPPLDGAEILACRAGIRVSTPQHLPLLQKVSARCFVIAGLGSKGLLYHALYAKKLCDQILL